MLFDLNWNHIASTLLLFCVAPVFRAPVNRDRTRAQTLRCSLLIVLIFSVVATIIKRNDVVHIAPFMISNHIFQCSGTRYRWVTVNFRDATNAGQCTFCSQTANIWLARRKQISIQKAISTRDKVLSFVSHRKNAWIALTSQRWISRENNISCTTLNYHYLKTKL